MRRCEQPFGFEKANADTAAGYTLVLHNDEVNTFDFVIETLVDVCRHEPNQAEQCALITHLKGQCDVKRGQRNVLEGMLLELTRRGLSATINPT